MDENKNSDFEILKSLSTNPEKGLNQDEINKRIAKYGENKIEEKKVNPFIKLLGNFWGPIPWMIETASILFNNNQALGRFWNYHVLMLFVNVGGRFWEEYKAGNAIEALQKTLSPTALVLRDGNWQSVKAKELVPGDIVRLQMGKIVPADLKLLQGKK